MEIKTEEIHRTLHIVTGGTTCFWSEMKTNLPNTRLHSDGSCYTSGKNVHNINSIYLLHLQNTGLMQPSVSKEAPEMLVHGFISSK